MPLLSLILGYKTNIKWITRVIATDVIFKYIKIQTKMIPVLMRLLVALSGKVEIWISPLPDTFLIFPCMFVSVFHAWALPVTDEREPPSENCKHVHVQQPGNERNAFSSLVYF